MLVKDFITKELPVLKSFDTGEYALALMDDFKLKHLPLLSENIYRCLVSEKDLLAMPDPTAIIGDPVLFYRVFKKIPISMRRWHWSLAIS